MARGEWAEAEHSFREAIRLRLGATVYSNLGSLYIHMPGATPTLFPCWSRQSRLAATTGMPT